MHGHHAAALRFGWIGSSRRYDYYYGKAKRTHRASEKACSSVRTNIMYSIHISEICNNKYVVSKREDEEGEKKTVYMLIRLMLPGNMSGASRVLVETAQVWEFCARATLVPYISHAHKHERRFVYGYGYVS